jgi:glucan phosphoethanolaminetransferase (alkaline phosphatase superfamily)
MNPAASELGPWLALAGLGAFHGLNPAMGWLFAVALGLHRHDRRLVWLSPLPIAFGHALSIAIVAALFLWAGLAINPRALRIGAGLFLMGWALYHWRYGHRHRVRFGMQTGLAALVVWSFLMATMHGAGLMLWPVLMPLCFPAAAAPTLVSPFITALFGVGIHTLAMLAVSTAIAVAVYEWIGLEILRHAWLNLDLIWTLALLVASALLLFG